MTDEEIIRRVTNKLLPPLKPGDKVEVLWETKDFPQPYITAIEKGWIFIRDDTTRRSGVATAESLKLR